MKQRALAAAIAAVLLGLGETGAAQETEARRTGGDSAAADVAAAPRERAITFDVGSGFAYDSNVAVLELDTAADAGDAAALVDFGVGYDKPGAGRFDLNAGYDFSETRHEDFDEFDVAIHRGSATLAWDLERVDTGASFQYAHAELDGSEFLVLEQFSPYIQKLMGERLFLRFALAHTDKTFAGNEQRNAEAASFASDAYVFLNGLTTYLVFGHRYDDEDARHEQFDYKGHRLKLQLNRRFNAGARTLTFKTYLRYETRDYTHPTASIGAPRRDDRYQFEALAELPLTDRVLTTFGYKHADNRSNLPALDFDENVFSVEFNAAL